MKKFKDFLYDKNDILIAVLILVVAASFIACVTFVCCLAGHLLGKKFGSWLGGKAEIFGGVILVCIGAKILVEHLSGG